MEIYSSGQAGMPRSNELGSVDHCIDDTGCCANVRALAAGQRHFDRREYQTDSTPDCVSFRQHVNVNLLDGLRFTGSPVIEFHCC